MEEEQRNEENLEHPLEKKKGKLKLILLIVFIVLCIGAGGTYFFFSDRIILKYSSTPDGATEHKNEEKKKTVGPILSFEPFLFNISGSNSRFAKVSIGIELKNAEVLEEAKKMMPVFRDRVLSVLGTKGPEMLMDVNSRDAIKKELHNVLKNMFKNQEDLTAIYITDIIIQ